jgi:hypothetical protein
VFNVCVAVPDIVCGVVALLCNDWTRVTDMAAAAEVQNLLRFLSQDAKVPLAAALPKVAELRKAHLNR